jgi:hypothetical protein
MNEKQLTDISEVGRTLVELTENQVKEMEKKIGDLHSNLTFMLHQFNRGNLTEEMKSCSCKLSEYCLIDLFKAVGYDGQLERDMENRVAEIRALNQDNRELRRQLGERITNENLRERIKNITTIIRKWWRLEGFGHVSDDWFDSSGQYHAMLSGHVFDQRKKYHLTSLGFAIHEQGCVIVDNDSNRQLLLAALKKRFPSLEILEWKGARNYDGGMFLHEVEICIFNLNDIEKGSEEHNFYESEITELKKLLAEIPDANVIERDGLEHRLLEAKKKLGEAQKF